MCWLCANELTRHSIDDAPQMQQVVRLDDWAMNIVENMRCTSYFKPFCSSKGKLTQTINTPKNVFN